MKERFESYIILVTCFISTVFKMCAFSFLFFSFLHLNTYGKLSVKTGDLYQSSLPVNRICCILSGWGRQSCDPQHHSVRERVAFARRKIPHSEIILR